MPDAKAGILEMYTGATKGAPVPLELGTRSPGSYLTQLSPDEQRLWDNLFNLFHSIRPFIDYLGEMKGAGEQPPIFVDETLRFIFDEPWHFVSDNVSMHWPDYQTMYDEYREASFRLMQEYEKLKGEAPTLGLDPVTISLLVVVVGVGGALLWKLGGDLIKGRKVLEIEAEAKRIEAEAKRMAAYSMAAKDFAAQGLNFDEHVKDLHEKDKTVAEDTGVSWPLVIKELTSEKNACNSR
jgi:hypothetical protein